MKSSAIAGSSHLPHLSNYCQLHQLATLDCTTLIFPANFRVCPSFGDDLSLRLQSIIQLNCTDAFGPLLSYIARSQTILRISTIAAADTLNDTIAAEFSRQKSYQKVHI